MHHYEFNIGNYRRDTSHLTLLEHGIYRQLLDTYYLNEMPLTTDLALLMRSHCVRTEDEQKAFKNVLSDFFTLEDDGWHHGGCDKVLEKIYGKSVKAKKSAEIRWAKHRARQESLRKLCESNAFAYETQSDGNANGMLPNNPITHNPDTQEQKEKKESTDNPITVLDRDEFRQKVEFAKQVGGYLGYVITRDGEPFPFYQYDVDNWKAAYAGVDVLQAILQMIEWLNADTGRLKPISEMRRFIVGWLQREADKCKAR